jgi:hypothetical protein
MGFLGSCKWYAAIVKKPWDKVVHSAGKSSGNQLGGCVQGVNRRAHEKSRSEERLF